MLNLLDDIHGLTDSEVTELGRLGPREMSSQILPACFNELARRVKAWIVLRHRPADEFTKLSDQLFSLSAFMDKETVRRTLTYARGFREAEPHVSRLIRLLGDAQNIEGLRLVRKTLRGAKWKEHRRLINDALIRAGCFTGADVRELVSTGKEPLSAFAACWFLWHDHDLKLQVHIPSAPTDLMRERYSYGEDTDIASFFYDAFWIALYVGFCAQGNDYSMIHPSLSGEDLGWLSQGLANLEETAKVIAEGRRAPTFSAVYINAADVETVQWSSGHQRQYEQYRAFTQARSYTEIR